MDSVFRYVCAVLRGYCILMMVKRFGTNQQMLIPASFPLSFGIRTYSRFEASLVLFDEAIRDESTDVNSCFFPFLSILSTEKVMGGPRLCLGGRSPTFYQVVDEAVVASFFPFLYTRCVYSSYGGPQALPGGAKPDSSGVEGIDSSFVVEDSKKAPPLL
jgi:hypothetical protein